jgi:integrase/recombinase XerD
METSFAEGLNEFEKYMGIKGYSAGTKQAYASHLVRFFEWLEGKGIRDVRRVGKDLLRAYLLHLSELRIEDKPLGWGTVCVRVRSVKRFFEYLEATQRILVNPAEVIQEPKRKTRLPKFVLSEEQVEKFLGSCDLSTPAGIRSRAILEVFYSTGIRLGELLALRVEDINLDEELLRVNEGKGAKDRVVPLGKQAAVFLKSYLSEIRPKLVRKGADEGHLWMSLYGTPLSVPSVQMVVKVAAKKAGIERLVSPHTLRHTFATHMVKNGADIILVSQLLGHSDLRSTQIYVKVAGVDVKKSHEDTHPREKDKMEKEFLEPVIFWKRGPAHA